MSKAIALDRLAERVIENRSIYEKLYRNEASHFVEGTVRRDIFKIKSYLSGSERGDDILYLNVNLVNLVAGAFADFVAGGGAKVRIGDEELQRVWDEIAEGNNFEEVVYRAAVNQSVMGYGVLRMRKEGEGVILEEIPYDYYYPEVENVALGYTPGGYRVVSVHETEDGESRAEIQSYKKNEEGEWEYRGGVYEMIEGKWHPLGEEVVENLPFLPIYQMDNQKVAGEVFGESDFASVLDLLEEYNDRMSQVSVQFVKHLNAKLALPESMGTVMQDEDRNINEIEYFGYRNGEEKPSYVEYKNSLIPEAQEYMDRIIRMVSAITQVPVSFFGMSEEGGAEKVEALKIKFQRFLKKVERKQRELDRKIKRMVKDALVLAGYGERVEGVSVEVEWGATLPKDMASEAEVYRGLVEDGIVSRRTAMEKVMGWDEGRINEEEEKLKK